MSNHSLYENNWINLVFENRNKEYGAFQLRQETTKTSFRALFLGILLCSLFVILPNLFVHPKEIIIPSVPDFSETILQLQDVYSAEKQVPPAPALPAAPQQKMTEAIETKQLLNPTVVSATQVTPEIEISLTNNNPIDAPTDGKLTGSTSSFDGGNATGSTSGTAIGTTPSNTNGTELVNTEALDKKPQFPGGIEKFYRYVGNNFNSPTLEETKNVRIYVSFIVEKDGSMSTIKVINKPGEVLEKEAIRVLKSIKTKWIPGIYKSQAVRTAYNLPITVQIN
ncbi:MAG: energy transducer TonB [Flavobacterium sp.]